MPRRWGSRVLTTAATRWFAVRAWLGANDRAPSRRAARGNEQDVVKCPTPSCQAECCDRGPVAAQAQGPRVASNSQRSAKPSCPANIRAASAAPRAAGRTSAWHWEPPRSAFANRLPGDHSHAVSTAQAGQASVFLRNTKSSFLTISCF
jgi:hypothetical protein